MTIYDLNEREIFENATRMCSADVESYLKSKKYTIFSIEDYIQTLEDNGCLEDELQGRSKEQFRKDLEDGKCSGDIDSGIYKDCPFVIEYCL